MLYVVLRPDGNPPLVLCPYCMKYVIEKDGSSTGLGHIDINLPVYVKTADAEIPSRDQNVKGCSGDTAAMQGKPSIAGAAFTRLLDGTMLPTSIAMETSLPAPCPKRSS